VLAGAISWGFKSPSPHHFKKPLYQMQRLSLLRLSRRPFAARHSAVTSTMNSGVRRKAHNESFRPVVTRADGDFVTLLDRNAVRLLWNGALPRTPLVAAAHQRNLSLEINTHSADSHPLRELGAENLCLFDEGRDGQKFRGDLHQRFRNGPVEVSLPS
jgi:hypothetical protein